MRYLVTLFICGALPLGLTTSLLRFDAGPASDAPDVTFAQSSEKVEAYDFVEVAVTAPKPTAKNPFTDIALTGEFRCGDGEPVAIQGFCDSADGGTYRIRFMPSKSGKHSYEVTFRQGDAEQKHAGTFEATDLAYGYYVGPCQFTSTTVRHCQYRQLVNARPGGSGANLPCQGSEAEAGRGRGVG